MSHKLDSHSKLHAKSGEDEGLEASAVLYVQCPESCVSKTDNKNCGRMSSQLSE